MGDLCEKSDFSPKKVIFPLEKMRILFKKSEKKVWLDQEWSGRIRPFNGYFQLENIFFFI